MSRGHSIYHYASQRDYELVLADVAAKIPVNYVVDEWRLQPDFRVYASPLEAPDFAVFSWPTQACTARFIVLPRDAELPFHYRESRQAPEKYGLGPSLIGDPPNYNFVFFDPSGFFRGEQEGMIQGWINTNSKHPDSLAIFNAFKKSIRKRFEREGLNYLGPDAAAYLDAGGRLGADLRLSREHDLTRLDKSELGIALSEKDLDKFIAALAGQDINARYYGLSLLERAVMWSSAQIVSYLLDQGAELGDALVYAKRYASFSEEKKRIYDLMLKCVANKLPCSRITDG